MYESTSPPSAGGTTDTRPTDGWRYQILDPGTYLWTSPHHHQYLVDHTGTLDVSTDRRSRHGRCATHSTNDGRESTREPAPPDD